MAENESLEIEQKEQNLNESISAMYARLFLNHNQNVRRQGIKTGVTSILEVIQNILHSDKPNEEILNDIRKFVDSMIENPVLGKQHPPTDDNIDTN